MSRHRATRQDSTAARFLEAGADLVESSLGKSAEPKEAVRLRQLREFPAALDWLHIDDVVQKAGLSKKAFTNRWPTRDDFLAEMVVYAVIRSYDTDPRKFVDQIPKLSAASSISTEITRIADTLFDGLRNDPHSYLLFHIGPFMTTHPKLRQAVLPELHSRGEAWAKSYASLLTALGIPLRRGWTEWAVAMALQAMLDGFLHRYRVQSEDYEGCRSGGASLFANAVIAFIPGVLDWQQDDLSAAATLDNLTDQRNATGPVRHAS
jgi:AcrR family transcriptional regulator